MNRRCSLFLAGLLLVPVGPAAASGGDEPVGGVEAIAELPMQPPFVGEPLRLVLRSGVRGKITGDKIMQPALTDFDWQQFGVDSSSEQMIDGYWTPVIERVLMIYPLKPGRLTIPPFIRRIAYLTADGGRAEIEFASRPFEIEVRAREGVGEAADPWLPAKRVSVADRWEPDPEKIAFGETAQRIVTIEADGVTADRLPPLPNFRAPGVITFAGPIERRTILTDQGPVGRAVYRWSVRPVSSTPAYAPAIRIPWFDVSSRTRREAVAPERRVSFVQPKRGQPPSDADPSVGLLSSRPLTAGLASFVATFAVVSLALSSRSARRGSWGTFRRTPAALGVLRRAARTGDVVAFRRAIDELSKADRGRWRTIAARDDVASVLAAIDAALFARNAAQPIALTPYARTIASAWKKGRANAHGDLVRLQRADQKSATPS